MNQTLNLLLLIFSTFAGLFWFYYYFGLYFLDTKKTYKAYNDKVALICPCYKEDQINLINTIESIKLNGSRLNAVMFVDDGSKDNTEKVFKEYLNENQYIILPKNAGKREAQKQGIERLHKIYGKDYFDSYVMIDSDTIIEKTTIDELIKPMSDEKVGGATSQILVSNRTKNFLTRCLSAMYWSSSNIWRKAPSNYGYMQVTNGQCSVYRARLINELLQEYTNQYWFGYKCSLSDDRWITHKLQTRYNKKIVYAKDSIAYTFVPETITKAYKMMLRWKKGSLREGILVTKHFTKKPLLVFDVWGNHLISFVQGIIRVGILLYCIIHPIAFLYYLGIILIISLIYGLEMVRSNLKEVPYRLGYSILNELVFGFLIFHAIKEIKVQGKNSWSTR